MDEAEAALLGIGAVIDLGVNAVALAGRMARPVQEAQQLSRAVRALAPERRAELARLARRLAEGERLTPAQIEAAGNALREVNEARAAAGFHEMGERPALVPPEPTSPAPPPRSGGQPGSGHTGASDVPAPGPTPVPDVDDARPTPQWQRPGTSARPAGWQDRPTSPGRPGAQPRDTDVDAAGPPPATDGGGSPAAAPVATTEHPGPPPTEAQTRPTQPERAPGQGRDTLEGETSERPSEPEPEPNRAWLQHQNPGADTGARERWENCIRTAIATDLNLAGEPAVALPLVGGIEDRLVPRVIQRLYGRRPVPAEIATIQNQLRHAGPGSRGIVWGHRRPHEWGHFFNAVNDDGVIRFLDGQTGGAADLTGFEGFEFVRTDNAAPIARSRRVGAGPGGSGPPPGGRSGGTRMLGPAAAPPAANAATASETSAATGAGRVNEPPAAATAGGAARAVPAVGTPAALRAGWGRVDGVAETLVRRVTDAERNAVAGEGTLRNALVRVWQARQHARRLAEEIRAGGSPLLDDLLDGLDQGQRDLLARRMTQSVERAADQARQTIERLDRRGELSGFDFEGARTDLGRFRRGAGGPQ